jgi:hypothetical protein
MADDLAIRILLDEGEVRRDLADANVKTRKLRESTQRLQSQLFDLDRLERRIANKIMRLSIRTGVGLAVGAVSESLGIESAPLGRLASATAMGLAVGGPTGAMVNAAVELLSEGIRSLKETLGRAQVIEARVRQTEKNVQEEIDRFRKSQAERERLVEARAGFERFRREEDLKERLYQMSQYVNQS